MVRHQHVHQLRQQDHRVSIPPFFIYPERSKFNQNNIFERILVDFLRHSENNLVNNLRDDAVFCHNGNHGGFDLEDECKRDRVDGGAKFRKRESSAHQQVAARETRNPLPRYNLSLSLFADTLRTRLA